MVDNFDLFGVWLTENKTFTDDSFLFLQIIRRRKENPDATAAQQTIKNFHITSVEDLMQRKADIVNWCKLHNARAYLRLNMRSRRKVALMTMAGIAENIANDNYNIKNCYESACGKYHSDSDKTWVVDLDNDQFTLGEMVDIRDTIRDLVAQTGRNPEILWVPTKNGIHLITRPFNAALLQSTEHSNAPFHKDNPSILYQP
jgi:hypothetical protein